MTAAGWLDIQMIISTIFQELTVLQATMSHRSLKIVTGQIIIGAEDGGLSVFKDEKFTNYTAANGLCDDNVWTVEVDKDENIWIGTDSCLAKFRDGKFETFTTADGLSGNNIRVIRKSANGGIWIGSDNGLDLFQNGTFSAIRRAEASFGKIHPVAAGRERKKSLDRDAKKRIVPNKFICARRDGINRQSR